MSLHTKPEFVLYIRRQIAASVSLDSDSEQAVVPVVQELDLCGFTLSFPEENTAYAVRIGDEWPESSEGEDFGDLVRWKHSKYFESARGRVVVHLFSRDARTETSWIHRVQAVVNVLPTKLGEERYQAMFDDLRAVSVGLVFDLLSKSRVNLGLTGIGAISLRPANAELVVLEKLWAAVSVTLQQIDVQPALGLKIRRERRLTWGSEYLGEGGLRLLASQGIDPRRRDCPRPFYAVRDRVFETTEIAEHRAILGFLVFLRQRIADCASRAREHILAIQKDRPFRDIDQLDGSNLFRDLDQPRMERLRAAIVAAEELSERVRSACHLPFLRGLSADFRVSSSPIFSNVAPYRRFRNEMLRYFGASVAILDEGSEDRAKSTGRMYEQWVFLQVLAALRALGLSASGQDGFLSPIQHRRFTIDLERGTRVMFRCPDGRFLSVRYEPWVHPAPLARSLHDTYYRGRTGENSWSPDILIELLTEPADGSKRPVLEYALVIDAKYTLEINARHKDGVRKYNEIRSTFDDRPAVYQVWLAHPNDSGIVPWDEAVQWTTVGPNRPRTEVINGCLGLLPPLGIPDMVEQRTPNETVLEFFRGTLAYLGITPDLS